MTSLGQYANGGTIECELLQATKIEGEIDLTELNTQSVSLEDKWKIYLDENDSFIIKNEIQNVISLEADGLTGNVTIRGSGGGGGATNLTDLQDVCATAIDGEMFFYNATSGKYEFTSNIKNDETNSRIIINDLSGRFINSSFVVNSPIFTGGTSVLTSFLSCPEISANEMSCNEINCNILNYNTLNPPISISTNLTDLQDVCATALNGDMFFYNATSGKYEFTNNIKNENSKIIINDLSLTSSLVCPEISANKIKATDISTQLFTIDNGGLYTDTLFNYNNTGGNYIRGLNCEIDVLSIKLSGSHHGVEIINNSVASTLFNKNNTGVNEINGNTTIGNLTSQEFSANEISCNILNYNTLNPPINVSTALTDLTDVCGTALAGDMFFYNATTGKYEFTNNIKNDIANDVIIIRDLHVEELGTSSALNKIIMKTNLDLSNNNLITDNIITSTNGLNIYTEGTGQNEPSLFLYKNIIGAIEHGGAKERLFIDAEDVFIGNDSLVKKDLICKDLSCESLTLTDITLTGDIRGGSILNIDPAAHGDETGLVVIKGNLQVDGSSTIINSSIVDISDIAILLAANAPNLSATDGAGIDISGGASLKYRYSSGAFNTGHWESNIDLSCETINTQNINNASKIVLTAQGSGTNSGVEIVNGLGFNPTIFNYGNNAENYLNGINFHITSSSLIELKATGTGTNSGVQIVNGAGINGSTFFNYANSGQNFIRGTKLDVVNPEIILSAEETTGVNDGFIRLFAQGTGTNSGVQIRNGIGNDTIFNYQNSASNFIHGTSRFFNDIHIQKIIDASNSTGNFGAVLMSEGTGTNKWSNNPSLPNYLYMGGVNVGLSGQVLVSQHTGGFPTWSSSPSLPDYALLSGATFTGDVSINANLNFDRLNNDTANIRFTSSTQNIGVHSPFIRIGDIEPTGRHGFDFKFRDWVYNNAPNPINQNWTEFTLFRAYGNTNGNGQFQVFGATYSAQGWNTSDDRFKHGEYNIANGLETIRNLVPQTYKKTIKMLDADNDGTNIGIEDEDWFWESGLIAQEIEKIPTLSKYVKELDNKKYVSYNNIHIHTISAVKELDTIVQQQAQLISSLEARLLALESK